MKSFYFQLIVSSIIKCTGEMFIKLTITTILAVGLVFVAGAQTVDGQDEVVKEGKKLYRLEMASWYGTDLMQMKFSDKAEEIGGYASYEYLGISTCVFFNRDQPAKVIATISFDSTYNIHTALVDGKERDMRPEEEAVITLRQAAMKAMKGDTLFKSYRNTNLNLVPVIDEKGKRVYVLTGPTEHGVVIFGNDYLLTFDDQYKILTKAKLHPDIIPIYYGKDAENKNAKGAMHIHGPGVSDLITATDICTLMLYEKFAGWTSHAVASKKYRSLWLCIPNKLLVLPMGGSN